MQFDLYNGRKMVVAVVSVKLTGVILETSWRRKMYEDHNVSS